MLTPCTSTRWSGSSTSSWPALATLSEQVQPWDHRVALHQPPLPLTSSLWCLPDTVEQRIENINEYFTFSLYSNVCRSLFEKHKLMFAFLLCTRIMMNEDKINMVNIGRFTLSRIQTGLLRRVCFCVRRSGATCCPEGCLQKSWTTQRTTGCRTGPGRTSWASARWRSSAPWQRPSAGTRRVSKTSLTAFNLTGVQGSV